MKTFKWSSFQLKGNKNQAVSNTLDHLHWCKTITVQDVKPLYSYVFGMISNKLFGHNGQSSIIIQAF